MHLDHHVGHYAKVVLDDVFGLDNFQNEIIWCYNVGGKGSRRWASKHDCIYFYSKGSSFHFDGIAAGVAPETGTKSFGGKIGVDEDGGDPLPGQARQSERQKYYRYYLDDPKIS